MKTIHLTKSHLNILAGLFFIVFAIFTITDARARILISDPALYLFHIIVRKGFLVPAERFTSVINQPLLVLAVNVQVPLKYLIPIYSISFVLIRALYYFLATTIFKCKEAGYAIIFITIVGVAESYFRPTSESTIALLNSILFYAWLSYAIQKRMDSRIFGQLIIIFVALLFILFGYYSHPLALFSLLFAIIYHAIKENRLKRFYPYITVLIAILIFSYTIFLTKQTTHHGGLYSNLYRINPATFFNELSGYYPYKYFWARKGTLYLPLFIITGLSLVALFFRKKWLLSAFFTLYIIFYFIITCVSFKEGESDMQMEKIFLPLSFFTGLAVMDFLILKIKRQWVGMLFLVVLFIYGFREIQKVKPIYKNRIEYITEIVEAAANENYPKFVLPADSINKQKMVFSWASGIESLILSTIDEDIEPLTVHISTEPDNLKKQMTDKRNYICAPFHSFWNYNNLNPDYFKLPEQEYLYFEKSFK